MRRKKKGAIGLTIVDFFMGLCLVAVGAVIGAYFVEEHYRKQRDRDGN
jgi:hypothetical protein